MSGGYLAYELLAGQAGLLLATVATVGLAGWLLSRRRPGFHWAALPAMTAAGGSGLIERLAWPPLVSRQLDPDARGRHRPRAPSPISATAA